MAKPTASVYPCTPCNLWSKRFVEPAGVQRDHLPEALADRFRHGDHFRGLGRGEPRAALPGPQPEPGLEMPLLQAQRKMLHRHPATVIRRPARDPGPEVGDF